MRSIELTVRNPSGLHARPAAVFVEAASGFSAKITVENLDRGTRAVNAKSLLMLLTVGVVAGQRIRIAADGPDEDAALASLRAFVEAGLGEAVEG